jgi:hypothetical protein
MMDKDKFAPRVDNTKSEKTGERNSDYSLWHRSLGPDFLALDIDWVEYRKDRGIVGFLAVTGKCVDERHIVNSKRFIWERTSLERKILSTLSQKLNVPSYFVIHNNDLSIFHVHDLSKDLKEFIVMNQETYGSFIKNL